MNYPILIKLISGGYLFCSSILLSCNNINNENLKNVEFISLRQINDCPAIVVNKQLSDEFLVINSQEELKKSVLLGGENPNLCVLLEEDLSIDFSKQTLLIGKIKIPQIKGELISENVFQTDNKVYTYRVVVKNGGYTALGLFLFGVIIPKISNDTKVNLDVEIQQDS